MSPWRVVAARTVGGGVDSEHDLEQSTTLVTAHVPSGECRVTWSSISTDAVSNAWAG